MPNSINPTEPVKTTCSISDLFSVLGEFSPTTEEYKTDMLKRLVALSTKKMRLALSAKGSVIIPGLD